MIVALTGVSGFIGSYTARTLHRAGHQVRALVRKTSRRDHIRAYVSDFIVGTHDDPKTIEMLVTGVDCVIHDSVDWSTRDASPIAFFQSNVMGSLMLLEKSRIAGAKQFIFVSSVATLHQISDEWGGQITETHPTWPGGIYGAYKAAIEAHLKAYHFTHKMNTSAWRPAAVYGIDPNLTRSQWYELVDKARRGETIETDRGGKITHVQDVADAITLAVGDESVSGEFFNLVDCYMYWQRAAEFARDISGSSATVIDRRGAGPRNQFDTAKAIAFFERHGNATALRRGESGVRDYVGQLLERIPAG